VRTSREALATSKDKGRVAFGTMKKALFVDKDDTPRLSSGLRVLIYVSKTGAENSKAAVYFKGPVVSYQGTFLQWQNPHPKTGQHPDPTVRPISAETDTAWMGFFEVENLTPCNVPLSTLHWPGSGNPIKSPPLGPDLVIEAAD
jgi:hypothetical protein